MAPGGCREPVAQPAGEVFVGGHGEAVVEVTVVEGGDGRGQGEQGGVDPQVLAPGDPGGGGQVGHPLVGGQVLGPAVRAAGIVQG